MKYGKNVDKNGGYSKMMKKMFHTLLRNSKNLIKWGVLCGFALTMLLPGCSESASAPYAGGLFISEVVSSNSDSLTDPVFGSPDWIELYNASDKAIDLENYSLYEADGGNRFTFPAAEIAPKSYLVVYCCPLPETLASAQASASDETEGNATATESAAPASDEAAKPAGEPICTGFKLSKNGANITLASRAGILQKLEIPALDTDISYGYCEDGSYAFFLQATPGVANTTPSFASLEELRGGEKVDLQISEILPKDVSNTEPYAWIELYNAGSNPVKLSDYYISENLSNLKKASLPAINLAAGEYAVIKFGEQAGDNAVPFKINSNETTLAISDHLGVVVDRISWDADILPGISAGKGKEDNTVYYTLPTPGAPNSESCLNSAEISLAEGTDAVSINELLINNTFSVIDKYGERCPWVELYNSSNQPVSLSAYALSDDPDSLWKWSLPDVTLDANSYIVIYLSGKDQKSGELHTNFKLGNADTALYLTNLTSQIKQTITLPTESKDNVSYGLSSNAQWVFYPQPTPMAPNTTQGFTEIESVGGQSAGVSINEVASVSEAHSGKADWVELYNGATEEIDLSGYCLSDSKNNTAKWPIAGQKITAGGYKVIDGYNADGNTGELTIALSGETLYLFNPQGLLLDQFETGVLRPGISRGIYTNSDAVKSIGFFGNPTPGGENGSAILNGYCDAPVFSVPGGYKTGTVTLQMTTTTEGGVIHYTTDGSTPTENSAQYTGPVTISSTETIRAVAVAEGRITSEQTVATYLFENTHSLPVVCLSISEGDYSTVVNSERTNKREKEGYVEYYEADGTLGVSFPAGFRVAGAGTIHAPQRSLNLYLRGGYGRSSVTYPFFGDYGTTTFNSLSLRNMGDSQDPSRLKDVFVNMAVNGMNIDNAQAKFAVVYLNGQYWGLYEFKENQNEAYFVSRHNIDPDKMVMVRGNQYNVETGSSDRDILNLYALAQRNMNDPGTFEQYTSLADSDYFMDYLIAETYFGCYDTYNQKYAHTTDGVMKWRPVFYDFDICLTNKTASYFSTYFTDVYTRREMDSMGKAHETYMYLYNGFIKNDEWKKRFIERYAEVLNTTLATDKVLAVYDGLVNSIRSEIPLTSAKWNRPSSVGTWENDVKTLRSTLEARRGTMINALQSYFGLSADTMKQLFPNG